LCGGPLELHSTRETALPAQPAVREVRSGRLSCSSCQSGYWILGGVALLIEDPQAYLTQHVKGISRIVEDSEIPPEFLSDYLEAKSEILTEHIEEDLEAERVNALYFMNHYLRLDSGATWWKPQSASFDPLIDRLVREYWDQGPFAEIQKLMDSMPAQGAAIELGCGVGGLARILRERASSYLGVDSSFASIALARHMNLGAAYPRELRIPGDLLDGPVSQSIDSQVESQVMSADGSIDFVVAELPHCPVAPEQWDLTVALNAIDMLDEPASLPRLQAHLLRSGGRAIQSCPYIWHEVVARALREELGARAKNSASAVAALYEDAGFTLETVRDHVPWLFFKHFRQLEIYSVHLFSAKKTGAPS
jgi:SAM-dependent methyltransferase